MTAFSAQAMDYLRIGGREVHYADGATIVKRGQAGEAFYVVISGEIDVAQRRGRAELLADRGKRRDITREGWITYGIFRTFG